MRNELVEHLLGVDDQGCLKEAIKYNGHQVASAELEGMLLGYPAIADAAVVAGLDERILRRVRLERDRAVIAGVR